MKHLTPQEFADLLGVSIRTIERIERQRGLRKRFVGSQRRYLASDAEDYYTIAVPEGQPVVPMYGRPAGELPEWKLERMKRKRKRKAV